jgi:hypothetical protein
LEEGIFRGASKPTAGVIKNVVMLGGFQELEFDFVAASLPCGGKRERKAKDSSITSG